MIEASAAWKDIQQRFILPEGYLEIVCAITELGLQDKILAESEYQAYFSNLENALDMSASGEVGKHATNELNLWTLDGSLDILPDDGPYETGYVAETDDTGSVTLTLPEVQPGAISGVTITWGGEHGEYPSSFTITARNSTQEEGTYVVDPTTVTMNLGIGSINNIKTPIAVGTAYIVSWNSTDYECTAYEHSGAVYLGNINIIKNDILGTPQPFCIEVLTDTSAFINRRSESYGQIAFSISTKVNPVVAEITVNDNTDVVSVIDMEMKDYDSVTISVWKWCLPYRRVRMDKIALGHYLTIGKNEILNFTHEQYGELNSGELPKNSIEFSINNINGRWNPSNPVGMEKYLSERQKITVRYGMDVNGVVEWIRAGTFYLSEWRAPANGMEASFTARDVFEYLLNAPYTGRKSGTLKEIAQEAFSIAGVSSDIDILLSDALGQYSTTIPEDSTHTCAEIVQMCANAASCIIRQDRFGSLHIERLNTEDSGYLIGSALSFAHPEVELTKQLKNVSVSYGENLTHILSVGTAGETQTVNNPLVSTESQAAEIASWVRDTLEARRSVHGEFRADPRLDLFDIVRVESKYGVIEPVAITNIKYTYNGAYVGSYTGRVIAKEGYLERSGN